jgi:SAM-dependent methyltransferase
METIQLERWQNAQASEAHYWDGMNVTELLRICAEKPPFLDLLGKSTAQTLFDHKDILEIGVGPLGISLLSFYPNKLQIQNLVKVEPLPRILISQSTVMQENWATPLLNWLHSLSEEGEYVQLTGEQMDYRNQFDTVVIYNVLDHVQKPLQILQNAYQALRPGGQVLVGVDCRSCLGRFKFEQILRRIEKGSVLVEAHPYTFLPRHVTQMLEKSGFKSVQTFGLPDNLKQLFGSSFRPAFIGQK